MVSADAPARPSAPGDPESLQEGVTDVWAVEVADADDARAEERIITKLDHLCISGANSLLSAATGLVPLFLYRAWKGTGNGW